MTKALTISQSITLQHRLAEEEARLQDGLEAIKLGSAEARLALYRIRSQKLYLAIVDEQGQPAFRSFKEYVAARWGHVLSPRTAFFWTSPLMRLASLGYDPEQVAHELPPTVARDITKAVGRWDYETQELAEPNESFIASLPNGDIERGVKELYEEAKALAEAQGAREAQELIRERAGEPSFEVYRMSGAGEPLKLKIVMTYYEHGSDPRLRSDEYYLESDRLLPEEVIGFLRGRLWFR